MKNYLDLVTNILDNGIEKGDRTGVGTRSIFGQSLRWNLKDGFPILTSRKVALRIAFEETMFFLRGETDTKKLEEKKINIWKGNTTRKFLDSRGLNHLPEGHYGKAYGFQWRNFGGHYMTYPCGDVINDFGDMSSVCTDYTTPVGGVDQVVNLVEGLQSDPDGRRHIITGWNPAQLSEMALPCCHIVNQYVVNNGRLDSSWLQRSVDTIFGLPYNIMSYAFLNIAFAKLLNLEPGELVFFGNDVHIYNNQMDMAREQITRSTIKLPELIIHKELNSLDDLLALEFSDIELIGYKAHPDFKNKPKMAV